MYVTKIEISGFRSPGPEGLRIGAVTLDAGQTRMQIPLSVPARFHPDNARHRLLLMAHALRQARRLPEFRKRGTMRFAPGLLPAELDRICA